MLGASDQLERDTERNKGARDGPSSGGSVLAAARETSHTVLVLPVGITAGTCSGKKNPRPEGLF